MLGPMPELRPGDRAPDFRHDSTDGPLSLADYRGQWLVLYFYPADFTGGCTREACDFRDLHGELDAAVVGVSPDPLARHHEFVEAHDLPFPLISDEDHALARAYGAWGPKGEGEGVRRSTFVIDPEGVVREAQVDVRSEGHVAHVRELLAGARA